MEASTSQRAGPQASKEVDRSNYTPKETPFRPIRRPPTGRKAFIAIAETKGCGASGGAGGKETHVVGRRISRVVRRDTACAPSSLSALGVVAFEDSGRPTKHAFPPADQFACSGAGRSARDRFGECECKGERKECE